MGQFLRDLKKHFFNEIRTINVALVGCKKKHTCTVLDIKRVENSIFHSMYIFSVIHVLHAIDKQDIST